jgi:hypothetical protein
VLLLLAPVVALELPPAPPVALPPCPPAPPDAVLLFVFDELPAFERVALPPVAFPPLDTEDELPELETSDLLDELLLDSELLSLESWLLWLPCAGFLHGGFAYAVADSARASDRQVKSFMVCTPRVRLEVRGTV